LIASTSFARAPRVLRWFAFGAVAAQLAACGTTPEPSRNTTFSLPPGTYGYVVGQPYTIYGKRYYPKEEFDYDRTGIASWYGPGFHGKRTASGETYNQDDMTAAHTTLQMPAMVEVTNLENGRKAVVRLNDRGPYHDDRIIDLSKRAAEELGFADRGIARVRVRVLAGESQSMKQIALGKMPSRSPTLSAHAPPETAKSQPTPLAVVTQPLSPPPLPTPTASVAAQPTTPVPRMAVSQSATNEPSNNTNAVKVEELPPPANMRPSTTQPPRLAAPQRPTDARPTDARPTDRRQPMALAPPDTAPTRSQQDEPYAERNGDEGDRAYVPPDTSLRPAPTRLTTQIPTRATEPPPVRPAVQPSVQTSIQPPTQPSGRTPPAKAAWNPQPNVGQKFYVQAGSFASRGTATQAERNLATIGKVHTVQATEKKGVFYRVRLGPYASADETERHRQRVIAKGYAAARIVTD